ncbi:MAG: hypothetical protein Q8P20_04230 [bacterium]|nr:hypothetical protein [bacterium]
MEKDNLIQNNHHTSFARVHEQMKYGDYYSKIKVLNLLYLLLIYIKN